MSGRSYRLGQQYPVMRDSVYDSPMRSMSTSSRGSSRGSTRFVALDDDMTSTSSKDLNENLIKDSPMTVFKYEQRLGSAQWRYSIVFGGMLLWGFYLTGDLTPLLLSSMPGYSGYVNSTNYVGMEEQKVHGLRFIVSLVLQFVLVMMFLAYPDKKNRDQSTSLFYFKTVVDFCFGYLWAIFLCMTAVPFVRLGLRTVSTNEFDVQALCRYTFGPVTSGTFRVLTHVQPGNGSDFGFAVATVLILTLVVFIILVCIWKYEGDTIKWPHAICDYMFEIKRKSKKTHKMEPAYFAPFMFVYALSIGWYFSFSAIPAVSNLAFGDLAQTCAADIAGLDLVAFFFCILSMLTVRFLVTGYRTYKDADSTWDSLRQAGEFMKDLVLQSYPIIMATVNGMWLTYAFIPMLNETMFPGSDVSWPWYPSVTGTHRASVFYLFMWTLLFDLLCVFAWGAALLLWTPKPKPGEEAQGWFDRGEGWDWQDEGPLRGGVSLTLRFSLAFAWASFCAVQLASYLLGPVYPSALILHASQAPQLFITMLVVTMLVGLTWLGYEFSIDYTCRRCKRAGA